MTLLTRDPILKAIKDSFEPLPFAHAMWEGGAASWGRLDDWSDIDLQIDVDDEHVAEAVTLFEQAVARLSPIDLKLEVPQPTSHGHFQAFYRLRDTSPYLLLDVVVMKHSNTNRFLEREIHGDAVVHFDKSGVVVSPPFDPQAWAEMLRRRTEFLRNKFELFQVFVLKELNRRNAIEAMDYYIGVTLRPLVEALRIHYTPTRYNFMTRYVYYELPADVVQKLEPLFFIQDAADLSAKHAVAVEWFRELTKG